MKPLVILYATREGHTRHIAAHVEAVLRERGYAARMRDVRELQQPFDLDRYDGAIVAASVHRGKHEPEMVEFVKRHRDALEALPCGFISVSLSEAGAEDETQLPELRAKAAAESVKVIDAFLGETGWRPRRVKPVAGALRYPRYNFLVRFVMKRIAKRASMSTDTSRDHVFTNWKALDAFVDEVLGDSITHASTSLQEAPAPA